MFHLDQKGCFTTQSQNNTSGQAWYMVRPWLGQPTREVVQFVQSELPEQPTVTSDGTD